MRKLLKNLPLALMVAALAVGCGKDNASGGKTPAQNVEEGVTETINAAQNFQSVEEVRKAFDAKSMDAGQNLDVYHVGTYFGAVTSSGFNYSANLSGCLNLIFWSFGDCGGYESNNNYMKDQMESVLDAGRLLKVVSSNGDSVRVKEATNVKSDLTYGFSSEFSISRNEILADAFANTSAYVSQATIKLSDGREIKGLAIQSNRGVYVLSTNLPTIANPLYVNSYNGYGYLAKIGSNVSITDIKW